MKSFYVIARLHMTKFTRKHSLVPFNSIQPTLTDYPVVCQLLSLGNLDVNMTLSFPQVSLTK